MKKLQTLTIIHQHPKILLGMKKRGFGVGRWNGFGGKLNEGETIEQAAHREIFEEAGIKCNGLKKAGIIDFEFKGNPEVLQVHIFKTDNYSGSIKETEEMKPHWFDVSEIPFNDMWPDDIYWMPMFLEDKKFKGKFIFGESDSIIESKLQEVKEI